MASVLGWASRIWQLFSPPCPPKQSDALKFGILGAARIAPLALIIPAKSHPGVVLQVVAARDRKRAEEFAKKHGIPEVRDSYQAVLDDPNIDCVFIPLPNGLHYEWAVKAIRAGKHVLLEKPSVSNAAEAEILFRMPELAKPNAPVLLEAFHYRFFPAWLLFRSFLSQADIVHVEAYAYAPWFIASKDDIRFNYALAGGTMMDLGTYPFSALREVIGADPEECVSCEVEAYTDGPQKDCDTSFNAKFRFPGGVIGDARGALKGPTMIKSPVVKVTHKEVMVPDPTLPEDREKIRHREVTLYNFIAGTIWHKIEITDVFVIRTKQDGKQLQKWEEKTVRKAYDFKEAGGEFAELPGEIYWMSYRHQLEQFVNKVKGRETKGWVSLEDSIVQMKMLDMAYEKSGLGLRPTSTYK